jgi:hypothetical protein
LAVSFETRTATGEVNYPFERDAVGYLSYTQEGYMAVAMMWANRSKFASADLRAASPEERLAAFDTYASYCGRYEVRGTTVVHRIELCLYPNWIGADEERYFEFSGNELILRTAPMMIGGVELTGRVIWQRVGDHTPTG